MEIIFLGTSAGVPTKVRNVSAVAVKRQNSKRWYLVDCGEATQQQLLHTKLSLIWLEAVLITHLHGDHCYGLPGLLSSASMAGRKTPLRLIGPASIKHFVDAIQAATALHLTFPIEFIDIIDVAPPIKGADFNIEAAELSHGIPSYGYAFTENNVEQKIDSARLQVVGVEPGPVWGQLIRGNDVRLEDGSILRSEDYLLPTRRARKIVIAGDNDMPQLLTDMCISADVLVHEATYTREVVERLGTNNHHSTAFDVASFARQHHLKNLVLTHFSPRYQYASGASISIDTVRKEAKDHYRGNLFLANDFDIYQLSREGVLTQKTI
ncbi:ribonuclease Z [Phytohalomonas tamaricis]|uniref:ribonuclease Z n=1 Tax=Phytohalomonas tamaricis TaxID=2081032 RepID=UPI000D0B4D00|nr:ribonuclease Z [Phytohalomonas tamaricis]